MGALYPSSVGSSSLQDETQGCLDLLHTTRPKCFDQDANLRIIMATSEIETLKQLGLLGEANFKAAKSLTAWD